MAGSISSIYGEGKMSDVIMQIAGFASGEPCSVKDAYVYSLDVQRIPRLDWLRVTWHIEHAKRWPSASDAMDSYMEILKADPVRKDGMPNRPMTAMHIVLREAPPPQAASER